MRSIVCNHNDRCVCNQADKMHFAVITYTLTRDYIPLSRITYQAFGLDKNKTVQRLSYFLVGEDGFASRALKNSPLDCFLLSAESRAVLITSPQPKIKRAPTLRWYSSNLVGEIFSNSNYLFYQNLSFRCFLCNCNL